MLKLNQSNIKIQTPVVNANFELNKKESVTNSNSKTKTTFDIDWTALSQKLPTSKSKEDAARRRILFRQIDGNGNGYLSLAEIDSGVRDVLMCNEIFDAKPAINRAFHAAKDAVESKRKDGKIYSLLHKSQKDGSGSGSKQGDD